MGALPKLDDRLLAVAELVRPGARCADVGCDHGHLIAWLCASGRVPGGYACDINQKPLEQAAFTLSEYGVADRVQTLLGDGLSPLGPGLCDDVVIAGMGGDLIWKIIDACPWSRDPALRFVLGPMTKAERLRRALCANGFELLEERAAEVGGYPYTAIRAAYTGRRREVSPRFAWCGLLWEDDGPAARRYREKAARLAAERARGLERSQNPGPELSALRELLEQLESRCKE